MGMAPMAHLLWTEFLKFNPSNPRWVRSFVPDEEHLHDI
jgi:transketolase